MRWNPTYLLGHGGTYLDDAGEGVVATTDAGARITAGAVLVCGGIGNFVPRELPVDSEHLGRGLRYFVPRVDELAGQYVVVVVGGGDSALDWALSLEPIASSVDARAPTYAVPGPRTHRRAGARIVRAGPDALRGREGLRRRVGRRVAVGGGGHGFGRRPHQPARPVRRRRARLIADLGPMEQWGLELRRRRILVDRTMRTNRQRVFAAGDIADHDGKVSLISIGFGEAALAVNHIASLLDPARSLTPGHSSDA
ncbi:FAD-dependent oxidoreductase [Streptomyces sp. V4I2]|uniref:FAD-dependent oxidoreductase n=1 Tax=Streptomyces sp. V4I2 TaxID=3042280 RepID=UPI002786986B|nr:FAD-dependent oxidoreductase [Streptomyces sp. V4I2]MDQ1050928.1 cation diffusion facilitator CzcD-associated flavoprotein CzcO [Streptomyces sp. V4I2]